MADEEKLDHTENSEEPVENYHDGGNGRTWWPWALLAVALLLGAALLARPTGLQEPAPIRYNENAPGQEDNRLNIRQNVPGDRNMEMNDMNNALPGMDPIYDAIDSVDNLSRGDNWDNAQNEVRRMRSTWESNIDRLDVGEDDRERFEYTLAKLEDAVEARDRGRVQSAVQELRDTLRGMGRAMNPAD